ncbi:hypothetical protein JL720_16413 [Aureococcus anophagefferens]|nr:hypothetical protein JL720_16413 [Aureococcus anophagefferens]
MRREAAFARAAGAAGVCPRAADRRRRARRSCENVCPRAAGAPRQCAHFRVRGRPAAAQIDGNARPDDERPFGFVCKNGRRRCVERLRVASAWGDPGWLWGLAPNVAALSLAGCRSVGDAPGLRGLARLAELDVSGSPYVTGFSRPAVRQLARTLARLDVSDCASMFCVDFVTGLAALEVFEARGSASPRCRAASAKLARLGAPTSLRWRRGAAGEPGRRRAALRAVDVAGCPALAKFPASLVQRGVLRGWGS